MVCRTPHGTTRSSVQSARARWRRWPGLSRSRKCRGSSHMPALPADAPRAKYSPRAGVRISMPEGCLPWSHRRVPQPFLSVTSPLPSAPTTKPSPGLDVTLTDQQIQASNRAHVSGLDPRIVPDDRYPGMYRGSLSVMVNLTRAKDALLGEPPWSDVLT